MAAGDRLAPRALVAALPALGVAGWGLWLSGAGPVNGDAAVYAAQAAQGELSTRWIHAVYIALLAVFRPLATGPEGIELARLFGVADGLSAAGAALAVGAVGWRWGGAAAWMLAALVLPWAPFGEVDPVWLGLLALGVTLPGDRRGSRAGAGLALGLATAISPTALAAVPWGVALRRDARWLGPLAAVLGLGLLSGGAWWVGERGVLTGGWVPGPGANLPWLLIPALLALPALRASDPSPRRSPVDPAEAAAARWALPWAALGLLAPADVPGHWVLGLALAPLVARAEATGPKAGALTSLGLLLAVLLGLRAGLTTHDRVLRENAVIARVAAALGPQDAVVAPWSWAVRVGVARTGDPYGQPWRPPGPPAPGSPFCQRTWAQVVWLPPGARPPGLPTGRLDPDGVLWTEGQAPAVTHGCW